MTRRHNDQQIESTEGLDYGLCSQTGARKTFIPVNSAEVHVALDNFRTQSSHSVSVFASVFPKPRKKCKVTILMGCVE